MNRKLTYKHQRLVKIGVVLPTSVELLVGTNDDEPSEDGDWEILSVHRANCEATPTTVRENMCDEDFTALNAAAAKAKDLP
jgi:hypothetical protein